ncbi:endoglucanase Z-like [Belonocnema kinseyi]|uniref:endoglucanase Z-like n=1 Tax=Belonocnema kinseyi TaxID=2817044 RepID=UPI00143DDE2E|nr:endoglucanase Z-like [Belonocnema kinseyi]
MAFIVAALLCAFLTIINADVLPLSVKDNQILIGGAPGSLSGMSLFWSNDGWGGEKFYNKKVVEWLKEDWKATVVRAAMGVEDGGGYLQDPQNNKARLMAVVDAAIELDMYVIIDWHSHYAHQHTADAIAFFEEMARTYGGKSNVIYELWNEPKNDVSWKDNVKPYAEAVIKAIRAIDTTNLILVGSPTWSQDVDQAASDPITGYENIAYTLHFYAGTHGQGLRDKTMYALNNNVAVFVSEWGTVNADGNGGVNAKETNTWVEFMKANHLSNCNWSLNDKPEGASALKPGVSADGGWSESDLTESGKFVREMIRNWYN